MKLEGYLFEGKFYYKNIEDLRGRTMSEENKPIPLYSFPEERNTSEITSSQRKLINKWIDTLCRNGYMHDIFGDTPITFKKRQYDAITKIIKGDIKGISNSRIVAIILSNYINLRNCDFSENELKSMLELFGFGKIEDLTTVYSLSDKEKNELMQNGRLKKGVVFFKNKIKLYKINK